jgi:hypothetical protein
MVSDSQGLEEPTPAASAPACPEAVFSLCLRGMIQGHDAQLTIRAQTVEEFKANVEAVRGLLDDAPAARESGSQPSEPSAARRDTASEDAGEARRFCPLHGTPMQEQHNERGFCWSHKQADSTWCKGREPKA